MVAIGANQFTFHLEDTKNPGTLIKDTWENEMKVRLAIKLGTTVEYLAPCVNQIDTISFMTVEPEFGGEIYGRYDVNGSSVEDSVSIFRHRGQC